MVEANNPQAYKNTREYKRFEAQLEADIALFERAREWADLSNCLQKVKKDITSYNKLHIPCKKELSKRLAQCLNPDLNVIHSLTLDVYSLVFQTEIALLEAEGGDKSDIAWGSDLGLFYSGLFNFYQFAAFENKKQFLRIIEQQVLKLEKELMLSLPGFMLCMLPALEDQNSDLLKNVEKILSMTEEIVGTSRFFGEIWKATLRTPRCRLSAIKFLDRRIPKTPQEAAEKFKKAGKIFESPHVMVIKNGRVQLEKGPAKHILNKSDVVMEEELTESELLERIENSRDKDAYFYFYYPNKEKLTNNALLAGLSTQGQSVYVNRAVFDFLISHMPITGDVNTMEEKIRLVEGALLTLKLKDFASLKKFFTWFCGHIDEDTPCSEDDPAITAVVPALKRTFQKYIYDDLPDIESQNYGDRKDETIKLITTPIQILNTLLRDGTQIVEPILKEITVDLIKFVQHYYKLLRNQDQSSHQQRFKSQVQNLFQMLHEQLKSVWQALGSLLSDEIRDISQEYKTEAYQIEAIDLITFSLRELKPDNNDAATGTRDENERPESMVELCRMLIPLVSRLLSGVEKLSNDMQNLEYALPAIELIEEILILLQQNKIHTEELRVSVENFNSFYINMCDQIEKEDHRDSQHSESFQLKYATFKKSNQILYKIQQYSHQSSIGSLPKWLEKVIKCSCSHEQIPKIVLISIETFLKLIDKEFSSDNVIMNKLGEMIMPHDDEETNQNSYVTEIIQNLWRLLGQEEDHEKIVMLLKKFDNIVPNIFQSVIVKGIAHQDREVKATAIANFSIFWKLTSSDYPKYKPFSHENLRTKYCALHNMLDILEVNDPTLRLACRSWLAESKLSYNRILDPLLEEFMDQSKIFVSSSKQIFFLSHYDTQVITKNFSKLRNIILNTQNEFIEYIILTKLSDQESIDLDSQFTFIRPVKGHDLFHSKGKYIQKVIYISLQYIMAQAVESLNQDLFQEAQIVNASACEFMELVLKSISSYTELSHEIAHVIIIPVIKTLSHAIKNKNNALQVHLLNLLKVILYDCNFKQQQTDQEKRKEITMANAKNIFKKDFFLDTIREGMENEQSFVRQHFIQFAQQIVPYMQSILKDDIKVFSRHIESFIITFCGLLSQVNFSSASLGGNQKSNKIQTTDNAKHMQEMITQNQRNHYKRFGTIIQSKQMRQADRNNEIKNAKKLVINQENDIIQIIHGLKSILNQCLNIKDEQKKEENFDQKMLEDLGKVAQETKTTKYFFGLLTTTQEITAKEESSIQNTIFDQISLIVVSCLYGWSNLHIFSPREYFFTRQGVFPYYKDDDKLITQLISDLEQRVAKNIDSESREIQIDTRAPRGGDQKDGTEFNAYINVQLNPLHQEIYKFLQPIAMKSPESFVIGIIDVWLKKSKLQSLPVHESLLKFIQILLVLGIESHEIFNATVKYSQINNLDLTKRKGTLTFKKQTNLEKKEQTKESLLCQFIYTYLLHNISNHSRFKVITEHQKMSINKLYTQAIRFFKCFLGSKHLNTQCWLMEILYILCQKFKLDDRHDKKLKNELSEVLDIMMKTNAAIISDQFNVKFDEDYGFNQKSLSPTVYELVKRFEFIRQQDERRESRRHDPAQYAYNSFNLGASQRRMMNDTQSHLGQIKDKKLPEKVEEFGSSGISFSDIQLELFKEIPLNKESIISEMEILRNKDAQKIKNYDLVDKYLENLNIQIRTDSKLNDYELWYNYKIFTLITLRQISIKLVKAVHNDTDKETSALQLIVNPLVKKVAEYQSKCLAFYGDEQKNENIKPKVIQLEVMIDLLATLSNNKENTILIQKFYKKEVLDMFYMDSFFNMSERQLRNWQSIMSSFLDNKSEVFEELMVKFKADGFFVSKDFSMQQKSEMFKRLAFLVYSSKKGLSDDPLELVLKKLTDGFKNFKQNKTESQASQEMQAQMFLLCRILMLRVQSQQLADALRKLWPHLLNDLVNLLDNPEKINYFLTIEAIKIVELMSQLNIEDFQMNQWIFLVDGYGLENKAYPRNYNFNQPNTTKEIFQPFLVKHIAAGEAEGNYYQLYNVKKHEIGNQPDKKSDNKKPIVINNDASVDNESLPMFVHSHVNALQFVHSEYNIQLTTIDKENAEQIVEKDFLKKLSMQKNGK